MKQYLLPLLSSVFLFPAVAQAGGPGKIVRGISRAGEVSAAAGRAASRTVRSAERAAEASRLAAEAASRTAARIDRMVGQRIFRPTIGKVKITTPLPKTPSLATARANATRRLAELNTMENRGHLFATTMALPTAKKLLNNNYTFVTEQRKGGKLLEWLETRQTVELTAAEEQDLLSQIEALCEKDKKLREVLTKDFNAHNYPELMHDLAGYYSLTPKYLPTVPESGVMETAAGEIFAQTTVDYLMVHPGKPTLKLREMIAAPFLQGTPLLERLKDLKNAKQLTTTDVPEALNTLMEAHMVYEANLKAASTDEQVLTAVEAYRALADDLAAFIKQYEHLPFLTTSSTESDLWNRMTIMLSENGVNEFGAALEQIGRIKKIVAENKPPYWTPQETAAKLAEFVNKNNRMPNWTIGKKEIMPQRLEDYDPEVLLVENMFYWRIYSRDFQESLGQIERKFWQTHQ